VIDFEANPAEFTDKLHDSGSAEYVGTHTGYGTLLDGHGYVIYHNEPIDGDVTLNVNFVNNGVGGSISIRTFFNTDGATNFGFVEVYWAGNRFEIGMNDISACPNCSTCCTDIQLIGALYGPQAEEAGGVVSIDYSQTDDESGNGGRIIGTTVFVVPFAER
jgi:hypothetical protein